MTTLFTPKKIFLILIGLIVLFVAYSYFVKPKSTPSPVLTSDTPASQKLVAGKEILTLLVDLKSLELDESIFKSKAFQSLQDFSLPIEKEPQGRTNPFAPIGKEESSGGPRATTTGLKEE